MNRNKSRWERPQTNKRDWKESRKNSFILLPGRAFPVVTYPGHSLKKLQPKDGKWPALNVTMTAYYGNGERKQYNFSGLEPGDRLLLIPARPCAYHQTHMGTIRSNDFVKEGGAA